MFLPGGWLPLTWLTETYVDDKFVVFLYAAHWILLTDHLIPSGEICHITSCDLFFPPLSLIMCVSSTHHIRSWHMQNTPPWPTVKVIHFLLSFWYATHTAQEYSGNFSRLVTYFLLPFFPPSSNRWLRIQVQIPFHWRSPTSRGVCALSQGVPKQTEPR